VTRHELARWYRSLYPNVRAPRWQALTLHDRTVGAWLWSKREGIVTGAAASAIHGAEWVDDDIPIELIFSCTRPPDGIVARESIKTVGDLRGKKVVLAQNSPSHYFLLNMLVSGGVQPSEVNMVFTEDAFQAAAAFNAQKDASAAVSWAPDIYTLAEAKGKGLVAIAVKAKFNMTTVKFLGLLATNGRASSLPSIITSFEALSAKARGAVSAEVTTAVALSAAQAKGVAAALRQALGKDPEIETRVDPSILGGIKVQVGSRLFDASLKSKLDSLKFALKRA